MDVDAWIPRLIYIYIYIYMYRLLVNILDLKYDCRNRLLDYAQRATKSRESKPAYTAIRQHAYITDTANPMLSFAA